MYLHTNLPKVGYSTEELQLQVESPRRVITEQPQTAG